MTALAFGTEAAICFPSSVNEANGCPLREISGRPQFKNSMFRRGNPPCFFAFDLLTCEGKDLRTERLLDRKQELRRLLAKTSPPFPLPYAEHVDGSGTALFQQVCELDLEGIVAKQKFSPYVTEREHIVRNRCRRKNSGKTSTF